MLQTQGSLKLFKEALTYWKGMPYLSPTHSRELSSCKLSEMDQEVEQTPLEGDNSVYPLAVQTLEKKSSEDRVAELAQELERRFGRGALSGRLAESAPCFEVIEEESPEPVRDELGRVRILLPHQLPGYKKNLERSHSQPASSVLLIAEGEPMQFAHKLVDLPPLIVGSDHLDSAGRVLGSFFHRFKERLPIADASPEFEAFALEAAGSIAYSATGKLSNCFAYMGLVRVGGEGASPLAIVEKAALCAIRLLISPSFMFSGILGTLWHGSNSLAFWSMKQVYCLATGKTSENFKSKSSIHYLLARKDAVALFACSFFAFGQFTFCFDPEGFHRYFRVIEIPRKES